MSIDPVAAGGEPEPACHRDLLHMARHLIEAAESGDHAAVSQDASALLEAFVRHSDAERPMLLRLPRTTARLVEHGQRRVVDRLVSLVLEADLDEEPCRCVEHAGEIASLVDVQIVSEEWDQTPG